MKRNALLVTVSVLALGASPLWAQDPGFSIAVDGEIVAGAELKPGDLVWKDPAPAPEPEPAAAPERVAEVEAPAEPAPVGTASGASGISVTTPIVTETAVPRPAAGVFGLGMADITLGRRLGDLPQGQGRTWNLGRAAFHIEGTTDSGVEFIAAADTGEAPLGDLLDEMADRDPMSVLDRFGRGFAYPTFGDDSTITDMTPTSGRVFLSARKGPNAVMWGDFRPKSDPNALVRNDRTYYGAMASRDDTETLSGHLFAASPDSVTQRDAFRATDGSVLFLRRSDLIPGSLTLSVESRDPDTGRVISREYLVEGQDFEVSSASGVITLRSPLPSGGAGGTNWIVAQYEAASGPGDLSGASYGGRLAYGPEGLLVGVSAVSDENGEGRQTLLGADASIAFGDTGEVRVEVARSEGPGYAIGESESGGLLWDDASPATGGEGRAYDVRVNGTLRDYGLNSDGTLALRYGRKQAGFTSLDTTTDAGTREAGVDLRIGGARFIHDDYVEADDVSKRVTTVGYAWAYGDWTVDGSVMRLDMHDPDREDLTGRRTDLSLAADRQVGNLSYGLYGVVSLDRMDGFRSGNRLGARAAYETEGRTLSAEVSGGPDGPGARLAYAQERAGVKTWAGYVLDPTDTGRTDTPSDRDRGRFVFGGSREIGEDLTLVMDGSYDVIGAEKTMITRYGLDYRHSEAWAHEFRAGHGTVRGYETDTTRTFVSWGETWTPSEDERLTTRLEFRRDSDDEGKTDTALLSWDYHRVFDENQRLISSADIVTSSGGDGADDYADLSVGYAWRPAHDDRLNLFVKYRYLNDRYGHDAGSEITQDDRQRQKSQVFSADATWELRDGWQPGAKLAYRRTVSGAEEEEVRNDAWLAVANVRKPVAENWDLFAEVRHFHAIQADYADTGVVVGAWRRVNENLSVGVGYNSARFSDDLTDLIQDDKGVFLNMTMKF